MNIFCIHTYSLSLVHEADLEDQLISLMLLNCLNKSNWKDSFKIYVSASIIILLTISATEPLPIAHSTN